MKKTFKMNMKNKLFKTALLAALTLSAMTIISCEIGMGSAVDTDRPKVEINYPPKNAIVRDSFVVAGECSDDLSIDSVSVTLQNASTKQTFGPYKAILDDKKEKWTVTLNKKAEGNFTVYDSYKKWEFPDGDYIITAVSKDKAKNSSQKATIPLFIDNTAPVLIVSKPLAVGAETAQKYGRTFNLAGDIAEEHSTAKLTIYYRRFNNTTSSFIDTETRSLSVSGFNAMSADSPLVIARYYSLSDIENAPKEEKAKLQEYRNNYIAIYGDGADNDETDDRLYYCGFLLEDNAKLYQNPKDKGSGEGNKTTVYYINSDDFSEKLSDENTYNINAQKIMEIINGTTKNYTKNEIPQITALLAKNGFSASSTELSIVSSSKFNLNPANNPYWILSGFEYNTVEKTFGQTVQAGGKLPVIINAGTDGVLIKNETVSVKIYHLGMDPDAAKDESQCLVLAAKGSLTGESSSLNPELSVDNSTGFFKPNHFYELVVEGEDKNGTPVISNGKRFGFMLFSAVKAPDITCNSPLDDTVFGKSINTDGITITGTIKSEIEDLSADPAKQLYISGFEVTDASSTNNTPVSVQYEVEAPVITGTAYDFNYSIKLKKKASGSLIPSAPGKYKYVITLCSQDSTDGTGSTTLTIFADNKGPETKIDSITPLVKNSADEDCVNGTVTLSGSVFDSGCELKDVKYNIYRLNAAGAVTGAAVKSGTINPDTNGAWILNGLNAIDTTDTSVFGDGKKYRFTITATDTVDNKTEVSKDFKVDQSTDRPKIDPQNSNLDTSLNDPLAITKDKNILKPGEKISTQIDDDDGIGSIKVSYRKAGSSDSFTLLTEKNDIEIKPYPFDFTVALPEGEYEIKIEVEDTEGLATGSISNSFVIAVDEGAPVFNELAPAENKAYYSKKLSPTIKINGKLTEGSSVCSISAQPSTSSNITQPAAVSPAGAGEANWTWSDTITLPAASNTYSVTYTATDKYGYQAVKSLEYKVDNDKPKLNSITVNSKKLADTASIVCSNTKTLSLTVLASDEGGSQIASVLFKKNNGEWSSMKKNQNANGDILNWTASADFADSASVDADKLYIKAMDNAGNESTEKEITLTIDSTKPSLDLVSYKTGSLDFSSNKTIYVNTEKLTLYGNYHDALSGVKALSFKIGGSTKALSPKYYTSEVDASTDFASLTPISSFTEGSVAVKAWSLEITKDSSTNKLPSGKLEIFGEDTAGNTITEDSFTLIEDKELPKLNIKSITNAGSPYQTGTNYYIRNKTDGEITLSGTSTDNFVVDHTELVITGNKNSERLPAAATYTTTASSWSFENIDLKNWQSTEATVKITAYDKAGNKTETSLKFIFDENPPLIVQGAYDAGYSFRGKKYFKYDLLRLGDLTKGWDKLGKYSQYSFGQETGTSFSLFVRQATAKNTAQDVRENTDIEEISGVAEVKYYLISANNTLPAEITYSIAEIEKAAVIAAAGQAAIEESGLTDAQKAQKILDAETVIKTVYEKLRNKDGWSEFDIKNRQKYTLYGAGDRYGIKAEATITNFAMTSDTTTNLLLLVPVDNCKNEGFPVILSIHADNTEPEVSSEAASSILTNGTTPFAFKGTAKDLASGLKSLTVKIGGQEIISSADTAELEGTSVSGNDSTGSKTITNSKAKFTYTSYIDTAKSKPCSLADAAAYVEWEVEVTPASSWFNYGTSDSPVVVLEAEDWAELNKKGNTNKQTVTTLKIDKKAPEVVPLYPLAGDQLNGLNNVSGTVIENNTPKSVSLYITKKTNTFPSKLTAWGEPVSVITTQAAPQSPQVPAANTSYSASTSAIYNYSFKDIDFYASTLIAATAASQDIYVLVVAEDEAGNKSVNTSSIKAAEVLQCKIDRDSDRPVITITNAKNNDIYDKSILYVNITDDDGSVLSAEYSTNAGTSWNSITNGKIENLTDGLKTIYFKVKDAKGKDFTSNPVSASAPVVRAWDRVRIKDSSGTEIIAADNKGQVFITRIDLERPDITLEGITKGSVSDTGVFTPVENAAEITQKFSEIILGGKTKAIKLRMTATDTNGIANVKAKLFLNDEIDPITEISAEKSTDAAQPDTYYALIPCSNTAYDGILKIRLTATDVAGREKNLDNYFTIDNKKPVIKVSNPEKETEQSGSISEEGTIDEYVKLYYSVSPFNTSPDALTTSTTWKYKYYEPDNESVEKQGIPENQISLKDICKYKPVSTNEDEMQMSFQLMFDGDTDNNTGLHSDKLNSWLSKMGITEDTAINTGSFENIVYLWLHVKAVDAAGNEKEDHRLIYWDPQGDRPKVVMTYPVEPADPSKKAVLGGNVTLMGTAMGTHPIAEVILKIDGVAKPVTLEGAGWTCPVKVTDLLGQNEDSRNVTITVQAKDTETPPNISRTLTRIVTIDKTSPVVKQNLRLIQWKGSYTAINGINSIDADGNISFKTDAVERNLPYEDGINVSGKWYLVGCATDDTRVAKISYKKDSAARKEVTVSNNTSAAEDGVYITEKTIGSGSAASNGVLFSFPVGEVTDDRVGATKISMTVYDDSNPDPKATDRDFEVFYDNKKPEIISAGDARYKIDSSVFNSNGYYEFGSVATEAAVSGVNQTGVKRIAFYFKKDSKIISSVTGNSTSISNLTSGEGLWWKEVTANVSNTNITLTAADADIHVGSLAKVNGAIYSVTAVSGTSVTIDGIPGNANGIKVYFARASVVNGNADDNKTLLKQSLITQGTTYIWSAQIDSKKIPDGKAYLNYVVFDGAGNYRAEEVECIVQNKAPRIAGITLGTDDDGNGQVDSYEMKDSYHNAFAGGYKTNSGNKQIRAVNVTFPDTATAENPAAALKVKGKTKIVPEIIGGYGAISYTYKIAKRDGNGWETDPYYTYSASKPLGTAVTQEDMPINKTNDIVLEVADMVSTGILAGNNQKFIFEIADSTEGCPLVATMNVIMDVLLIDTTAPQNNVIPFYWKGLKDNSLYDSKNAADWRDLKGHIELPADLAGTGLSSLPKVSGKIKIEGIARDEVLLHDLSVTVSLGSKSFPIAAYANGNLKPATKTMEADGWSVTIQQATFGEYLSAGYITALPKDEFGEEYSPDKKVPYFSQDYGHVVHWVLNLDTEKLSTTKAKEGVSVSAKAVDRGQPNASGAYPANGGKNTTDEFTMDIVPYILGIRSELSSNAAEGEDSSEYDRTALGNYPLAYTEKPGFYGFNLKQGAKVKDQNGKTLTLNASSTSYSDFAVYPVNSNLADFGSGKLSITVDDVESINNKNNNDARGSYLPEAGEDEYTTSINSYNRKPNSVNNYKLTDDVIIDVWEFNSTAAKPYGAGVISDPIMKINPNNGMLGFAYQSGARRFSMANGNTNSYQAWIGDWDNLSATGFAYDTAGNTYGTALGGDINKDWSVSTFNFLSSLWGVVGKVSNTWDRGALQGSHNMRLEEIGQIGKKGQQATVVRDKEENRFIDKARVLSPSIAVSGEGTAATVYLAYYDHLNREIRFRWAENPKTGRDTKGWANGSTSYITDDYVEGASSALTGINDVYNYYPHFQIIAEDFTESGSEEETATTTLGKAGPYVDIAVIPNGKQGNSTGHDVVIMVWYDSTHGQLKYTYNKIALNSTAATFTGSSGTKSFWQTPKTIFKGAGQYGKLAVDIEGGIHIAAYDSIKGDLRYAYLSSYGADYTEETDSCIVDSNGIVGSNLTIDVAKDKAVNDSGTGKIIPYIGYYGSTGPKLASLNVAAIPAEVTTVAGKTGAVEDVFTGYWEITEVPVPANSNAPRDRVSVGVYKNKTTGVLAVPANGGTASTHSASGEPGTSTTSANGKSYGNKTTNPVVAYQIRPTSAQGYIETAQKR